jgi:hypothetical protein
MAILCNSMLMYYDFHAWREYCYWSNCSTCSTSLPRLQTEILNTVTWWRKAGITDPEKTSVIRQRHGKHVSAVTNNHARTGNCSKLCFLCGPLHKNYYRKSSVGKKISGRGPQRAGRQGELIGGKSPFVKYLWLWLFSQCAYKTRFSAALITQVCNQKTA